MRRKNFLAMATATMMAFAIMFSSVGAATVNAAEALEKEGTEVVVIDMNDVIDGEAIVYAADPTASKVLSKDYATSTGQTELSILLVKMWTSVV